MSITKYPPKNIINSSNLQTTDYEFIILWMLHNNQDGCKWADFLSDPLEFSQATLSKYLNILKRQGFVKHEGKGSVYRITTNGILRYHEIVSRNSASATLIYPPEIILSKRNYEHIILWMLNNNNSCKWGDFLEDPISINQTSLSKSLNSLLDNKFIIKNDEREYCITDLGESHYLKILKKYDLDRQSILDEESKRIEFITEKTSKFFETHNVNENLVKYRFLSMLLKLDYSKTEVLASEEEFDKVILYLALNHPNQYPSYISPEKFAQDYNIDPITLKFLLGKVISDQEIYPKKFFKLESKDSKTYYFQEDEKIEQMLKAIVEDFITQNTYLNKFHEKASNGGDIIKIKDVFSQVINELTLNIFHKKLRHSLEVFLPNYINYLAYKIETRKSLLDPSDKLESFTYRSFFQEYQLFINTEDNLTNGDRENFLHINAEILEILEPFYLNKIDFLNTFDFKNNFISQQNLDLFEKILDTLYRDKITKVEGFYLENTRKFTDFESLLISDLITTINLDYQKSIEYTSQMIINEPESYIGYLLQSLTYFEMSEFNKAMEIIEKGIKTSENIFLKIQKAQLLLKMEQYTELHKYLEELINSNPEDIFLLSIKSLLYCKDYNCRRKEENLEIINKALQIKSDDKRLLVLKAINLCYSNKLKQVKAFIKKELGFNIFSKNTKIDTSALFMLVFSYLGRGKYEKSLDIAKELKIQFPDHILSLFVEAMIQGYNLDYKFSEKERNQEKFEGIIDKVVSLEPVKSRKAKLVHFKALILYSNKDYEKANQEIDKAMELDNYCLEFAFRKIFFLINLKDPTKVLKFIDDYLKLYPERETTFYMIKSLTFYNVGRKLENQGNKEKAYDYYKMGLDITNKALETNPNYSNSLNNKVMFLAAMNIGEEAIQAAKNLVTLYPDDGNHFDTYAQVLMQFGAYEEAIETFKKAIEIDPTGFYVHISYNKMAECYKELGDYESALEAAEKSKEIYSRQFHGEGQEYDYNADKLIEELKELLNKEKKY